MNVCPSTIPWGGSVGAVNTFISSLDQTRGLPAVPSNPDFPIFKTKRGANPNIKTNANIVEEKYLKLNQNTIRRISSNDSDINALAKDAAYKEQAELDFDLLRLNIILSLQTFYDQL